MSKIIKQFYTDNNTPKILLDQKVSKFGKHPDIADEFEYWIKNNSYKMDNPVSVEGYTAKELFDKSEYLNGEGAFMMLIELRENPTKALKSITEGLKWK